MCVAFILNPTPGIPTLRQPNTIIIMSSSPKPPAMPRPAGLAPPHSPRTEESPGYRRGRAIRSCLECRRRKMRCNRSRPCQNCNRFCRDCVYLPFPEWPSGAPNKVKVEGRSHSPEQGVGRALPSFPSNQPTPLLQTSAFSHLQHQQGYSPDALVKHEGICDVDPPDQSLDLTLKVGRLGITKNLGGFFRPHVAGQVSVSLPACKRNPGSWITGTPGGHLYLSTDQTSLQIAALLSQTSDTVGPYNPQSGYGVPPTQQPPHPAAAPCTLALVKRVSPLEPSPGFLTAAPQSFLPQPGFQLPSREELQLLYRQYWSAVDPLTHIIHKPSFEVESQRYLRHSQTLEAAPASFKALLLAMCLAAAVSLPVMRAEEVLGVAQQTLVERLKIATEKALTDAGFMNSVKIQTLQAFTIYLVSPGSIGSGHHASLTNRRSLNVAQKSPSRMQCTSERSSASQRVPVSIGMHTTPKRVPSTVK